MIKMTFPECFHTGELTTNDKSLAIADGLSGWTICAAGEKPPEKFGRGMAAIATMIGCAATPDNLTKLADEFLKNLRKTSNQ